VNKNSTNNLTDFASWGETPAEVRLDPISPGRVRDSRRDAQLLTERGFRALRLSRVLSDGGGPVANPFPVRACCSLSESAGKDSDGGSGLLHKRGDNHTRPRVYVRLGSY
jgi:hypothetical protein